jgi:hypothetical protein
VAEGGGIEGLIDTEAGGGETDNALAGADAVALAVATDSAKHHPELARKAGEYLEDQRALVRLQIKHFEEERVLAIAAAKRKRYAERIRNGLATFAACVVGIVALAFVVMVWNAYDDRGLVVEAFSVPPDFAQKGITGKVVAAEVLDQVNLLQTQTHTARPAASFRNNWGDDIKVEIPDTGISIGELSRILHDKLGHATRIEGDVVRTEGGLVVSARIRDEPAMRASGPEPDLAKLVQQVTEQAYGATQPYRYAAYLSEHDRMREAMAAFRALAAIFRWR